MITIVNCGLLFLLGMVSAEIWKRGERGLGIAVALIGIALHLIRFTR